MFAKRILEGVPQAFGALPSPQTSPPRPPSPSRERGEGSEKDRSFPSPPLPSGRGGLGGIGVSSLWPQFGRSCGVAFSKHRDLSRGKLGLAVEAVEVVGDGGETVGSVCQAERKQRCH